MSSISLTNRELEIFIKEFSEWKHILNIRIGLLSFTIASACALSESEYSAVIAQASLVFVLLIVVYYKSKFPSLITKLRKKKGKSIKEQVTLKGLMGNFFSAKSLVVNFHLYIIGYGFLGFMAVKSIA